MSVQIIKREAKKLTLQIEIELDSASMLRSEEQILAALNEAGCTATKEALEQFDTDGRPIDVGGKKLTSKGQKKKKYETPYGQIVLYRHIYQSSDGGKTYCPLEVSARILVSSTPKFSKQVSSK